MEEPRKHTWYQKRQRFRKSHSLKIILGLFANQNLWFYISNICDCVKWRTFQEPLEKFIIIAAIKCY